MSDRTTTTTIRAKELCAEHIGRVVTVPLRATSPHAVTDTLTALMIGPDGDGTTKIRVQFERVASDTTYQFPRGGFFDLWFDAQVTVHPDEVPF